jgi:hypothetical protein
MTDINEPRLWDELSVQEQAAALRELAVEGEEHIVFLQSRRDQFAHSPQLQSMIDEMITAEARLVMEVRNFYDEFGLE